jgi:hypothetical protein
MVGEEIEILRPELLVVEEGERLGRIRIFVNPPAGKKTGLLHPDARPAQLENGGVAELQFVGQLLRVRNPPGQLETAIQRARIIAASDGDRPLLRRRENEPFASRILTRDDRDFAVHCQRNRLMKHIAQPLHAILHARRSIRRRLDIHHRARSRRNNQN